MKFRLTLSTPPRYKVLMDHLSSESTSGAGLRFSPKAIEAAAAIPYPSRCTMVRIIVRHCARGQRDGKYLQYFVHHAHMGRSPTVRWRLSILRQAALRQPQETSQECIGLRAVRISEKPEIISTHGMGGCQQPTLLSQKRSCSISLPKPFRRS